MGCSPPITPDEKYLLKRCYRRIHCRGPLNCLMDGFVGNCKRQIIRNQLYVDKLYAFLFLHVLLTNITNSFSFTACCLQFTSITSNLCVFCVRYDRVVLLRAQCNSGHILYLLSINVAGFQILQMGG